MNDSAIAVLVEALNHTFNGQGWHGPTLTGALRGVKPDEARWKPDPDRNDIWSLMLHCAYWKYIVRRRLTGDKTLKFAKSPSNWPKPSDGGSELGWKQDVKLLKTEHAALIDVVTRFPARGLHDRAPESKWTYAEHIHGAAAHDAYHTGQIQLLKRLYRSHHKMPRKRKG